MPTDGAKGDDAPLIPLCGGEMLFEDDRLVLVFLTLYIFVGGVCYCQCFSCATALLRCLRTRRTRRCRQR